ncbi:MAG: tetratricopeptide repeat protein [Rubrivivax sp.]|nr:tetratricopeptide repeat protein [Rubrivivax sp.]
MISSQAQLPLRSPLAPLPTASRLPAATPKRFNAGHPHWRQGLQLMSQRDWAGAAKAFTRATHLAPKDALYWVNLANAERQAGAPDRAEAAARRALKLQPDDRLALQVLGDSLASQHRYGESIEIFAQLEATGALDPEAMVQQAAMLQSLHRPRESMDVLLRALAVKPHLLRGHALLADACRDLGLKREAVECMKTVLALDPGNLEALSHLSFEKRHLCDWGDLQVDIDRIAEELVSSPPGMARVAAVFGLLSLPLDPALHLVAAQGEAAAVAWNATPLPAVRPQERALPAGRKPRIGWLSYDFREHPVSQLLVELLEQIDRQRFEVVLYSSGPDDASPLRRRVEAAADRFVDLRGSSDGQAAAQVRADGIDILIDLMGHTRGHRLGVLAARPAPVQVSFLGYPGSTGANFIDYLIGDPLVTPTDLAPHFSEKLAQMPLTFQPNGRWRPLPQPMSRAQAGLPEVAFVMCAFNHTYKILPEAFDSWCQVMREVPNAVLWLKETNPQLHDNVRREAQLRGVDADRIVLAKVVSYADHFSRLALADVFVDTWPYNAHTTAADALWAGVPVVTLYGNSFASRVAASVLNAAGMAELAFGSVEEYRCAIQALALEPDLAAGYKRQLNEQRNTLRLFDSSRYTREFEALLARMWAQWQSGRAPDHLIAA